MNADVLEGHRSTALCHIGNISHRLGQPVPPTDLEQVVKDYKMHEEVPATLTRMIGHLRENGVDLDKTPLTLGPLLQVDAEQERFRNHSAANELLGRDYRRPFVLPDEKNI